MDLLLQSPEGWILGIFLLDVLSCALARKRWTLHKLGEGSRRQKNIREWKIHGLKSTIRIHTKLQGTVLPNLFCVLLCIVCQESTPPHAAKEPKLSCKSQRIGQYNRNGKGETLVLRCNLLMWMRERETDRHGRRQRDLIGSAQSSGPLGLLLWKTRSPVWEGCRALKSSYAVVTVSFKRLPLSI